MSTAEGYSPLIEEPMSDAATRSHTGACLVECLRKQHTDGVRFVSLVQGRIRQLGATVFRQGELRVSASPPSISSIVCRTRSVLWTSPSS